MGVIVLVVNSEPQGVIQLRDPKQSAGEAVVIVLH